MHTVQYYNDFVVYFTWVSVCVCMPHMVFFSLVGCFPCNNIAQLMNLMWKIRRETIFRNNSVLSSLFYSKHYSFFFPVFFLLVVVIRLQQHPNRFFNKSFTWIIYCYVCCWFFFSLNAWAASVPVQCFRPHWSTCVYNIGKMFQKILHNDDLFGARIWTFRHDIKMYKKLKFKMLDILWYCTAFYYSNILNIENESELWNDGTYEKPSFRICKNRVKITRSQKQREEDERTRIYCNGKSYESTWYGLNILQHTVVQSIRLLWVYLKPDPVFIFK